MMIARRRPALVLRHEHHEHEDRAEDEHEHGRVAGQDLLQVSSVHSKLMVEGSSLFASDSISAIAWPELTPGVVPPAISADGNML